MNDDQPASKPLQATVAATVPNSAIPLELQWLTRSLRTSAIVIGVLTLLSVYLVPYLMPFLIPCAFLYFLAASQLKNNQVPKRKFIMWMAILSIPTCIGIFQIIVTIDFWRMYGKLKDFEIRGAEAFMSDEEWVANMHTRTRNNMIVLIFSLAVIGMLSWLYFK